MFWKHEQIHLFFGLFLILSFNVKVCFLNLLSTAGSIKVICDLMYDAKVLLYVLTSKTSIFGSK